MKYRKLENRAVHYRSGLLREITLAQVFINNEPSGSDTGRFFTIYMKLSEFMPLSKQKPYVFWRARYFS